MNQQPPRSVGDVTDCTRCGGLMMISDRMVNVCGQCLRRGNHRTHQRKQRTARKRPPPPSRR